jgi:hypothetical protein
MVLGCGTFAAEMRLLRVTLPRRDRWTANTAALA